MGVDIKKLAISIERVYPAISSLNFADASTAKCELCWKAVKKYQRYTQKYIEFSEELQRVKLNQYRTSKTSMNSI